MGVWHLRKERKSSFPAKYLKRKSEVFCLWDDYSWIFQKAYRGISHPDLNPFIITYKRKIKFLEDEYYRKVLEQGTEDYQEK